MITHLPDEVIYECGCAKCMAEISKRKEFMKTLHTQSADEVKAERNKQQQEEIAYLKKELDLYKSEHERLASFLEKEGYQVTRILKDKR